MPSIASSVMRPRSANGIPSAANSPSTCPAPTPRITRPPDSASRVPNALAVSSGCRYAATNTLVMSRTFVVWPASQPSVATGWYQVVDIVSAFSRGIATWSQTAT